MVTASPKTDARPRSVAERACARTTGRRHRGPDRRSGRLRRPSQPRGHQRAASARDARLLAPRGRRSSTASRLKRAPPSNTAAGRSRHAHSSGGSSRRGAVRSPRRPGALRSSPRSPQELLPPPVRAWAQPRCGAASHVRRHLSGRSLLPPAASRPNRGSSAARCGRQEREMRALRAAARSPLQRSSAGGPSRARRRGPNRRPTRA